MVYQRKQRAYEQEQQRPVPPVQTSLFNSPDLETEEADNAFSVDSSQPGPSMEVRHKQASKPFYTFDNLVGSRPVYPVHPSDSAVQRHPMFPAEQAQRTGSLDSHFRHSATRHDFFGSGKPAVQRTKMAAADVLQRSPEGGAGGAGAVELTPQGSGRPLPKQVSDNFVQSGYPEVKNARVHVDDTATQSIQAHGYTMKNDIVVQSRGANDPKLLAHEATHVVQQSQMALKPDVKDTPINANPALEQNADDNSDRVARNQPVSVMGASAQGENGESAPQPSPVTVQPSSLAAQTDLQSGRMGGPTLPQQTNGMIQRKVYLSDAYRFSAAAASSYLREETVRSHLLKAGIHEDRIEALVKKYVTGKNSDINNISLSKLLKDEKKNNAEKGGKAGELEEKANEIEEEIKPKNQAGNALFKLPNDKQGNAVSHDGLSLPQARKYLIRSGIKEPVVDSIIKGYKMEQKYSIPYRRIDEIVKKLSLQEGHYHKIGQSQGSGYDPALSAAIRSLGASLKTPWEFKYDELSLDELSLSKAREYLLNKGIEKQTIDSILKYYEMDQKDSIPVKELYKIAYDLLFQQNPDDVQDWKSPYEAALNDDEKDISNISEHDEEEKRDHIPQSVTSTSTSASSSMSKADQQQKPAIKPIHDQDNKANEEIKIRFWKRIDDKQNYLKSKKVPVSKLAERLLKLEKEPANEGNDEEEKSINQSNDAAQPMVENILKAIAQTTPDERWHELELVGLVRKVLDQARESTELPSIVQTVISEYRLRRKEGTYSDSNEEKTEDTATKTISSTVEERAEKARAGNNEFFELSNSELPEFFTALSKLTNNEEYAKFTKKDASTKLARKWSLNGDRPHHWAHGARPWYPRAPRHQNIPGGIHAVYYPENLPLCGEQEVHRGEQARFPWAANIQNNGGMTSWAMAGNRNPYSRDIIAHTHFSKLMTDSAYLSTSTDIEVAKRFTKGSGWLYKIQLPAKVGIDINKNALARFVIEDEIAVPYIIPYGWFTSLRKQDKTSELSGKLLKKIYETNGWDQPFKDAAFQNVLKDHPAAQYPDVTPKQYLLDEHLGGHDAVQLIGDLPPHSQLNRALEILKNKAKLATSQEQSDEEPFKSARKLAGGLNEITEEQLKQVTNYYLHNPEAGKKGSLKQFFKAYGVKPGPGTKIYLGGLKGLSESLGSAAQNEATEANQPVANNNDANEDGSSQQQQQNIRSGQQLYKNLVSNNVVFPKRLELSEIHILLDGFVKAFWRLGKRFNSAEDIEKALVLAAQPKQMILHQDELYGMSWLLGENSDNNKENIKKLMGGSSSNLVFEKYQPPTDQNEEHEEKAIDDDTNISSISSSIEVSQPDAAQLIDGAPEHPQLQTALEQLRENDALTETLKLINEEQLKQVTNYYLKHPEVSSKKTFLGKFNEYGVKPGWGTKIFLKGLKKLSFSEVTEANQPAADNMASSLSNQRANMEEKIASEVTDISSSVDLSQPETAQLIDGAPEHPQLQTALEQLRENDALTETLKLINEEQLKQVTNYYLKHPEVSSKKTFLGKFNEYGVKPGWGTKIFLKGLKKLSFSE